MVALIPERVHHKQMWHAGTEHLNRLWGSLNGAANRTGSQWETPAIHWVSDTSRMLALAVNPTPLISEDTFEVVGNFPSSAQTNKALHIISEPWKGISSFEDMVRKASLDRARPRSPTAQQIPTLQAKTSSHLKSYTQLKENHSWDSRNWY